MDIQEEDIVVDISLDDVCPICLEGEKLHTLSCGHVLHLECAKNMTSASCPVCRSPMSNIPSEILESIQESGRQYQADLEEEDRQRISVENINPGSLYCIYVNPRPSMEIRYALHFLRTNGIPLSYVPEKIVMKIPADQPRPPPGVLFSTLVGHTLDRMAADAESSSESDSDEDSDEDPFEDENRRLLMLTREIHTIPVDSSTYLPLQRFGNEIRG